MTSVPTPSYQDNYIVIDPADDVSVEKARSQVDKYFTRTREAFSDEAETTGLWGVYLRGPSVAAFRRSTGFMVRVLNELGSEVIIHGQEGEKRYAPAGAPNGMAPVQIFLPYAEGDLVPGAGQPMLYYHGPAVLVDELETGELQRLGFGSICALNAREQARLWPEKAFLDMAARHIENHNAAAYGCAVGSKSAQKEFNAIGFVGTSTDEAAHWFGTEGGKGTTSHAFVGRAGSTVKAAEKFIAAHPSIMPIILVDYFGKEVTDGIAVAQRFNGLAAEGKLGFRLDTHGDRFLEGLDYDKSHEIVAKYAPQLLNRRLDKKERDWLFGKGVSAAAVFYYREQLDAAGFPQVKICASSGFSPEKVALFAEAKVPVDIVGTGSYLPKDMEETYAKAETLGYNGKWGTKAGREWVLGRWERDATRNKWTLA